MKVVTTLTIALGLAALAFWAPSARTANSPVRVPVLVELFTSEGCSSCPPADAFLQTLDRQPVPGAEVIVLSEHVDYWNHIGWRDPYSSRFYSDRQGTYARRFGLDGPYTPQMVVDGVSEFVGSDRGQADRALAKALGAPKIAVRLSAISFDPTGVLQAHVETASLPSSHDHPVEAEIYVVVAINRAQSQVSRGENAGRTLAHVAVAVNMMKAGTIRQNQAFTQDIHLKLSPGLDPGNLRLVAFVQEVHQGKVVGATAGAVRYSNKLEQALVEGGGKWGVPPKASTLSACALAQLTADQSASGCFRIARH